jgi:hypothetical protein
MARHRHHPVGDVPQLAEVLLRGQDDAMPPLGIARLVHNEHAARMRPQRGMGLPALQPSVVERFRIPGRRVQEVVQRLPVGPRHDRPQFDERLVVLSWQEQADEILAQRRALLIPHEQVVEGGTELVNRFGGRPRRLAFGGHRHGPRFTRVAGSVGPLPPPAKRSTIRA